MGGGCVLSDNACHKDLAEAVIAFSLFSVLFVH
jgi:hypothetical protein